MDRLHAIAIGVACLLAVACPGSAQTRTVLVPRRAAPPTRNSVPAAPAAIPNTAVLPAGLPLRIQLDRRYRMRIGEQIFGRLIDPVYSGDDIVLPVNTIFRGIISSFGSIGKSERAWELLDGDVTPLKKPVLTFTALKQRDGRWLPLKANATDRTAALIKMSGPQPKQSLIDKGKAQIEAKKQSAEDVVFGPHKTDRALKFVYGQLPYHPQEIWPGTQFDAVLEQPLTITSPRALKTFPETPPHGHLPPGTLDVRLLTTITSATDKVGDPVRAVLTRPYFNATKTGVILPTGTPITGVITQAKPARALGRNGTLRFAFRQIQLPTGTLENMHGQMTAVEGTKGQNLTVDSEGGAKANPAQGRFLAPLLLGAMAGHSFDGDAGAAESGAYSNGFGLVARVVGFVAVTPAVSAGFAFYSAGKSITRRWLMSGHNVVFAKNTRMELSVADR